jgi:hypothetical protein
VWLYRIWPQALHIMVLVKPATVIHNPIVDWGARASSANKIKVRLYLNLRLPYPG